MKICTICNIGKPFNDFHKQADTKDGFCCWCKPCKSIKKRAEYLANRDKRLLQMAEYRRLNPEKVSARKKRCYENKKEEYLAKCKARRDSNLDEYKKREADRRQKNKQTIRKRDAAYKAANRDRLSAWQCEYQKNNPRFNHYQNEYRKAKIKANPLFAMENRIRRALLLALKKKGYKKTTKTALVLGCDYETLMAHLEQQFTDGMTWDNRHLWHIDHKIPVASASTEQELLALCHYTNLQPLWARDNLKKGAKILPEFQKAA